jgi:hypothetical protein
MAEIKDYRIISADNDAAPPDGAPERMDRDLVNNVAREMMGAMARDARGVASGAGAWRDPNEGAVVSRVSDTEVSIAGIDVTLQFPANRKTRITYASGNPGHAFVVSSTFSTNTNVVLEDFDAASPDDVVRSGPAITEFAFGSGFGDSTDGQLGRQAYENDELAFIAPTAFTDAAISAALVSASSSGKIVLLQKGTYAITDTISVPDNARILGLGAGTSILQPTTNSNIAAFTLAANATDVDFSSFEVDGNAANQNAAGIAIRGGEGNERITIQDLFIHDTYGTAIQFDTATTAISGLNIKDVVIDTTGGDGILIDNPAAAGENVLIANVVISNPGINGAAILSSSGLSSAVKLTATSLRVSIQGASLTGAGIRLRSSGGDHLTDFDVTSVGATTSPSLVGILVEGDGCDLLGGSIAMDDSSTAVSVMTLSGDHNVVYDTSFNDGAAMQVTGAYNNIVDCRFDTVGPIEETAAGNNTNVRSSTFFNMPDGCVSLAGDDSIVRECTFNSWAQVTASEYAISLAGARNIEFHNLFPGADATSPTVETPGTFSGTGSEVFISAITQSDFGTAEVAVTGMEGIDWPLPPNGQRRFIIQVELSVDFNSADSINLNFANGPLGTISDPNLVFDAYTRTSGSGPIQLRIAPEIVTPVADSTFSVSVNATADANHDILESNRIAGPSNSTQASYCRVRYLDG